MSYRKEARKNNIPLKFIQNAVLEGDGASIEHYAPNDENEIKHFKMLEDSDSILSRYFDVYCDNSFGRNDEVIYTTNWLGLAPTRSKKQRVRRHASLVKMDKIARKHQRNFKPRRQKTPTLVVTSPKAEPIDTPF